MKLRNKLIPILSVGSVALATPIALTTSCGFSIDAIIDVPSHNMLKEYENHVRACDVKRVVGTSEQISNFYTNEIANNTDILKDDIMFTISRLLNKSKTQIESKLCKFTKYQLNVKDITTYKDDSEQIWTDLKFEAKIAGEPVDGVVGTKKIKSFDMYFQAWYECSLEFDYQGKEEEKEPYKGYQVFKVNPSSDPYMISVIGYGSYTYEEAGQTKTVSDYQINESISGAEESNYPAGWLFGMIYKLSSIVTDWDEKIYIASSYLNNVEIVESV